MPNSVSAAALAVPTAEPVIAEREPALPLRNDTILGVCEALGQDFGFHANWLRVPLAAMVLISTTAAIGIYLGLGVAVLASRLLYPAPRPLAAPQLAAQPAVPSPANQVDERADEQRLAA